MEMSHNAKKFKELFDSYYTRLYYAAVAIVNDPMTAEDIVEDVFVRFWERMEKLDTDDKAIYTYLLRMTYNKCDDHIRHRNVQLRFNKHYLRLHSEGIMVDDNLFDERMGVVERVRKAMPDKTRQIMDLCYYDNKQYTEVAAIVGLSKDGVRKHVMKALAMLREAFSVKKRKRQ